MVGQIFTKIGNFIENRPIFMLLNYNCASLLILKILNMLGVRFFVDTVYTCNRRGDRHLDASAVFVGLTGVTDRQTNRQTTLLSRVMTLKYTAFVRHPMSMILYKISVGAWTPLVTGCRAIVSNLTVTRLSSCGLLLPDANSDSPLLV